MNTQKFARFLPLLLLVALGCEEKDYCAYSSSDTCVEKPQEDMPKDELSMASCGDGTVQTDLGEACDHNGNIELSCAYGENSCEVCNAQCQREPGKLTGYCGDNVVQSEYGELCDHAGDIKTTCAYGEASCQVCNSDCKLQAGIASSCGDGMLQPESGEECEPTLALDANSCLDVKKAVGEITCNPATCKIDYGACLAVTDISLGYFHGCAVLENDTLRCWGDNTFRQLGDGSTTSTHVPVLVSEINNAEAVVCGYQHTCALLKDKTVKCWGWNKYGQLGNGKSTDSGVPVQAIGVENVAELSASFGHTCVRLNDGKIQCWGSNEQKQLEGVGDNTLYGTPQVIRGSTSYISMTTGFFHTCASNRQDGILSCWGDDSKGQSNKNSGVSARDITQVRAGVEHTCAILKNKTVRCWGSNSNGELGIGSKTTTSPPQTTAISNIISINPASTHTCALNDKDEVFCWGSNESGQLSNNPNPSEDLPFKINNIEGNRSGGCRKKRKRADLRDGRASQTIGATQSRA